MLQNHRKSNIARITTWRKLLAEHQESYPDMSVQAYCDMRGVTYHAYYYWKHKIATYQESDAVSTTTSCQVFTEVKLPSAGFVSPACQQAISICWGNAEIRLDDNISPECLTKLLCSIKKADLV